MYPWETKPDQDKEKFIRGEREADDQRREALLKKQQFPLHSRIREKLVAKKDELVAKRRAISESLAARRDKPAELKLEDEEPEALEERPRTRPKRNSPAARVGRALNRYGDVVEDLAPSDRRNGSSFLNVDDFGFDPSAFGLDSMYSKKHDSADFFGFRDLIGHKDGDFGFEAAFDSSMGGQSTDFFNFNSGRDRKGEVGSEMLFSRGPMDSRETPYFDFGAFWQGSKKKGRQDSPGAGILDFSLDSGQKKRTGRLGGGILDFEF